MAESQTPDPLNVYAFSKIAMERLARRYAPRLAHPVVGLRYSNVYGPGEAHKGRLASMIHQLAAQMLAGRRPRIFTAGQQKRDFVYIDDVVNANLAALRAAESGVYNAGRGKSWSFNEVVAELNRVLNTDLPPRLLPQPLRLHPGLDPNRPNPGPPENRLRPHHRPPRRHRPLRRIGQTGRPLTGAMPPFSLQGDRIWLIRAATVRERPGAFDMVK